MNTKTKWLSKEEWLFQKRAKEAVDFSESKADIQMQHEDPNLFMEIIREIQHPHSKHYTTGRAL